MRSSLVVTLALMTGCREDQPARPVPPAQWWCWANGAICTVSRDECEREVRDAKLKRADLAQCVAHATAYCTTTCEPGSPACFTDCSVTQESCEKSRDASNSACEEATPPRHAAQFPLYVTPGWWCWEMPRPVGGPDRSICTKDKTQCEWFLDDYLTRAGWTRTSVPGRPGPVECRRPVGNVYCLETTFEGKSFHFCSLTMASCTAQSDELVARGGTLHGTCAPWRYE